MEGEYRVQPEKPFAVTPKYVTVIRTGMTTWAACARGCGREGNADNFPKFHDSVSSIQARFGAIEIQTCPYYRSNCEITMGIDIPGTFSTLTKPATLALLA